MESTEGVRFGRARHRRRRFATASVVAGALLLVAAAAEGSPEAPRRPGSGALPPVPSLLPAQPVGPVPVCEPVVPCFDPTGCPDLVVDPRILFYRYVQEQTFAPEECAVVEGLVQEGVRRLLRFPTLTLNLGPGAIVIGDPYDHPEWYELVTCHGHPHFNDYADYRLWTPFGWQAWSDLHTAEPEACSRALLASHPELRDGLATGRKQGFCLLDSGPTNYLDCADVPEQPAVYTSCFAQGLSRCAADYYRPGLDGQWIDVTDLAPGFYVLEIEVNPLRRFQETNYANNASAVTIYLPAASAAPATSRSGSAGSAPRGLAASTNDAGDRFRRQHQGVLGERDADRSCVEKPQ